MSHVYALSGMELVKAFVNPRIFILVSNGLVALEEIGNALPASRKIQIASVYANDCALFLGRKLSQW